jgi:hypothetical protein
VVPGAGIASTCTFDIPAGLAAGTYQFLIVFQQPFTPPAFPQFNSDTSFPPVVATYDPAPPEGGQDEQTVIVEIPVGVITITTPYTPANPLDLGVAVLDQGTSTYSASALFDRVTISDTRAGDLGFQASIVAGPFTSATDSFPGSHTGFTDVTAVQVPGNALQATDVATVDTPAVTPGIGAPRVFATYAPGLGLGSVEVTATLGMDDVPTSVQPGLYQSTVTFTAL